MMIDLNHPIANHVHNSMDYFQCLQRIDFVPSIDYSWSHHLCSMVAFDCFVEDCDVVQQALVMEAISDGFFPVHFE